MKKTQIQLSDHFTYQKLLRFVLPSIVMMVFTSIYGVVDGLFVSNFAGKTPFAAINLVMPFIMVLGGIGFMIGTGGTALVSKVLGEGEPEKAKRYFTMMILFTLLVGAVLTVFGVTMMEKVARFFGATDEMLHDCVLYGRIVITFTAAFMLQNVFQSFLILFFGTLFFQSFLCLFLFCFPFLESFFKFFPCFFCSRINFILSTHYRTHAIISIYSNTITQYLCSSCCHISS